MSSVEGVDDASIGYGVLGRSMWVWSARATTVMVCVARRVKGVGKKKDKQSKDATYS